jgi:3-hydroxybutyryl-CoA dehydratase
MKYKELEVGKVYKKKTSVTDEMVRKFAEITGDDNPVHLNDQYAATTIFKKRISHGVLVLGLISAVLGREFPGPGTIYLNQNASFRRPVYLDEPITVVIEVLEKIPEKSRLKLSTNVIKDNGELAIDGDALVIFKDEE